MVIRALVAKSASVAVDKFRTRVGKQLLRNQIGEELDSYHMLLRTLKHRPNEKRCICRNFCM